MTHKDVTYKDMVAELESILERLETDGIDLDEAIALHKKGQELAASIEDYLKKAENTITKQIGSES